MPQSSSPAVNARICPLVATDPLVSAFRRSIACLWLGGVAAGTANCVGLTGEAESRQPSISMPPNMPTSSEAPATMGIQMRSRSLFHSWRSASIVFVRHSSEYSTLRLARSTWAATPLCESVSSCSTPARSSCALLMVTLTVCCAFTVSCTPHWRKCWRRVSPSILAICFGSRPASISLGKSASRRCWCVPPASACRDGVLSGAVALRRLRAGIHGRGAGRRERG